jgi:TonB family protein
MNPKNFLIGGTVAFIVSCTSGCRTEIRGDADISGVADMGSALTVPISPYKPVTSINFPSNLPPVGEIPINSENSTIPSKSIRDDSIQVNVAAIEKISPESDKPISPDSPNADTDLVNGAAGGQYSSDREGVSGAADSYITAVRVRIASKWIYPPKAVQFKIGGTVSVEFTLLRDGSLGAITILKSSGWPILDEDIVRVIKSAAPFPKFPTTMPQSKIVISGKYNYDLNLADD